MASIVYIGSSLKDQGGNGEELVADIPPPRFDELHVLHAMPEPLCCFQLMLNGEGIAPSEKVALFDRLQAGPLEIRLGQLG